MIYAEQVNNIYLDCLYTMEEIVNAQKDCDVCKPNAPMNLNFVYETKGFNPIRLQKHVQEIEGILNNAPILFASGESATKLCYDNEGNYWGNPEECQKLIQLGIAIGDITYSLPEFMWQFLPEGAPYIIIHTKTKRNT